jgi:hypothetical protein
MGYFVMAFVWFWMALVGLVLLRTGLFLAALLWMGVRQWYDDLRLRRT